MAGDNKTRVDVALVERGLAASRERAQSLIRAGAVYFNGVQVLKPAQMVEAGENLMVSGEICPYVSRGGLKLQKALHCFHCSPSGVTAMDLGASTGGFTDVLLQHGAAHVYAVDVGTNQLAARLREDTRVTVMEHTNARDITREMFSVKPTLAVMDVSFISIRLILPAALNVLAEDGRMITLIKPQFEAGRGKIGKRGVVSDVKTHAEVLQSIVDFVPILGWHVHALDFSPITGAEGNIEFLADLQPGQGVLISRADISDVVTRAHRAFKGNSHEVK